MPKALVGTVDGFDRPAVLRGWVVNSRHNSLGDDIKLTVFRGGQEIASGAPTAFRPDISSKIGHQVGFRIDCRDAVSIADVAFGCVSVVASDT